MNIYLFSWRLVAKLDHSVFCHNLSYIEVFYPKLQVSQLTLLSEYTFLPKLGAYYSQPSKHHQTCSLQRVLLPIL